MPPQSKILNFSITSAMLISVVGCGTPKDSSPDDDLRETINVPAADTDPAAPSPPVDDSEAAPDEAKPDEAKPDEAAPDEAAPDEAAPDEAKPDEAKPDEAKPDETVPIKRPNPRINYLPKPTKLEPKKEPADGSKEP